MDDIVASRELAVRLVRAAERVKADFAEAVAPFGLSVPAARALLLIDEPMAMRDVSDRLACDKSYITRIADELEGLGLVQRVPGSDRRVQLLKLTRTGVRKRTALSEAVSATDRVTRRLDDADQRALERALTLLLPD